MLYPRGYALGVIARIFQQKDLLGLQRRGNLNFEVEIVSLGFILAKAGTCDDTGKICFVMHK